MSKTTSFQEAVKAYLDKRADDDPVFAMTYAKENKSIEECVRYILGEVNRMNRGRDRCLVLSDEEVYGMAVHYYDEDDIEVADAVAVERVESVAASQTVKAEDLTEEEREEARKRAREMAINREAERLSRERAKRSAKRQETPEDGGLLLSLFGDDEEEGDEAED